MESTGFVRQASRYGLIACLVACGCEKPELVAGRWVDLEQTGANGVLRNLAVSSKGTVFVASRPGVLRSRSQLTFETVGDRLDVDLVAVDLQDHVYAAIEQYEQSPAPLRISVDGGDSWTAGAVPAGFTVDGVAADPSGVGRVYVVGHGDLGQGILYRSDDGGVSFTKVSDWGGVLGVDGDGTVYLAQYNGLWRSRDRGASFEPCSGDPDSPHFDAPRFLLADPASLGHVIVGTQEGLYTTFDSGATWSRTDPAATTSPCSVIYQNAARVPGSPDEIYMAVNAAGIYYSADNGFTWETRNLGLSGDCLTPFGIGVAVGPEVVVYATVHGYGSDDSVYAYLAP